LASQAAEAKQARETTQSIKAISSINMGEAYAPPATDRVVNDKNVKWSHHNASTSNDFGA
jgi:hypothetical protein